VLQSASTPARSVDVACGVGSHTECCQPWRLSGSFMGAVAFARGRPCCSAFIDQCLNPGSHPCCLQVPTQEFFARDMGLPLEMKPNYEDFSCQFR
jgi:hypothetical protein